MGRIRLQGNFISRDRNGQRIAAFTRAEDQALFEAAEDLLQALITVLPFAKERTRKNLSSYPWILGESAPAWDMIHKVEALVAQHERRIAMRLKRFTDANVVSNLVAFSAKDKQERRGLLWRDGRFSNGYIWVQLPPKAAEKARAKLAKGEFNVKVPAYGSRYGAERLPEIKCLLQTENLPDLKAIIKRYRQGKLRKATLKRFYLEGDNDYSFWQVEFLVRGNGRTPALYDPNYVLALEYAGATRWVAYCKDGELPVLEGWNGDKCIGGVMPIKAS